MNLSDFQKYFALRYDQFITQNNVNISQISENVRYEKLERVCRIDLPDNQYFFYKNDKLQLIYISDEVLAKEIWGDFQSTMHSKTPEKTVRSRAGKTSNQIIFAEQGISASVSNKGVDFIEIFSPQSIQNYLENIYREPQLFIR
ncbi:MAG TPA: hypothetical protein VGK59_13500 [Ohtaekwangia sp.]